MEDFKYIFDPIVPSGTVVFTLTNRGSVDHEFIIFKLDEDVPAIDVQLSGSTRRSISTLAGVPPKAPGQNAAIAVDLKAGVRYAFVCFLYDDGQHALKGMATEFRAQDQVGLGR